jgi:alginate O-acetyltransferase complex protein AlgI
VSLVSISFLLFFGVVFAAYWAAGTAKSKNWILLLASYAFYASFDWRYCGLLLAASAAALGLGRAIAAQSHGQSRRMTLLVGLVTSLGVLGLLKYMSFFSGSIVSLAGGFGLELHVPTLRLLLPIGVSFFLFKIMSYLAR